MALEEKAARITVDLGDRQLYKRLRLASVESDMTIREIVIEALEYWLDHQEEIEDRLAKGKAARVAAESSGQYITHDDVKAGRRH